MPAIKLFIILISPASSSRANTFARGEDAEEVRVQIAYAQKKCGWRTQLHAHPRGKRRMDAHTSKEVSACAPLDPCKLVTVDAQVHTLPRGEEDQEEKLSQKTHPRGRCKRQRVTFCVPRRRRRTRATARVLDFANHLICQVSSA